MAQNNENMAKNELDIKPAGIDKDNLVLMREEDFKKSVENDKLFKRFLVNFAAECLTIITDIQKDIKLTNDVLTMAFSNEMQNYYVEQANAQKREKAMKIVEKSHQKSQKAKK